MPRTPRIDLPGFPQHIVQRGNNRQATFYAERDYEMYLGCLADAARKYRCFIHAYVLMTNHVHLLATSDQPEGLSRMMQHLGRLYVRYINTRYRRSGTLWEGRFKASLIDAEDYFLRCCCYIELNPVRACIVSDPGEYRWSSYRYHASGMTDPLLSPHELYLRLGASEERRQHNYQQAFRMALDTSVLAEIRETVRHGRPLGGNRFKAQIEEALRQSSGPG